MKPQSSDLRLLSLLLIIFLLDFCFTVDADLASDESSLLALRAAIGGPFLLIWNIFDERPCNWTGVACEANKVVELRLPGMGLSGPIPPHIANLASLRHLYLQGNLFYGHIPEFLFNLRNLVSLNLANNNFTGAISPSFNNLARLSTLYLEGNNLTGSIPDLNLGSLDQFNVSFNKLSGPIPEGLSSKPANSFEGNSLCGKPLLLCKGSSSGKYNKLAGGAIAGVVIGCFAGCLCKRKRIKQGGVEARAGSGQGAEMAEDKEVAVRVPTGEAKREKLVFIDKTSEVFELEDLLRASAEVLGKGRIGTSYKGVLETGRVVVVKRLKNVIMSEKEFAEMITTVGDINHQNLLPLTAYHYGKDEKFLVYEYMPKGSLYALLHGSTNGDRSLLNWDKRTGIALGAARAIAHLHSQGGGTSHGSIKSSNILLTATLEACVSDFGLTHVVEPTPAAVLVDGYGAPEVTDNLKESQKADVYSFGVVLLELLTGKSSIFQDEFTSQKVSLPRWILPVVEEELTSEVFELDLLRYENVEENLVRLLQVAINCISQDPHNRPSMAEVKSQIEELCRCRFSSPVHEIQIDVEDDNSSQLPSS